MVTRSAKLARAREIIAASPTASRRAIADSLRLEGKGLRDATILSLQREAYPERRRIIVEPYQLAKPIKDRFKPQREGRYNKLVGWNFNYEEALKFSRLPLTKLSFIKNMAKSRKELVNSITRPAKILKTSKTQTKKDLKAFVDYTYKDSGWVDKDGEKDAWEMLRSFRKDAIDKGEYIPRPRKIQSSSTRERYRKTHKDAISTYAADYRRERKSEIKTYAADYRRKQREEARK